MNDPFHLARFIEAQSRVYRQALEELGNGEKRTHWMWFIFPQIAGLGASPTSRHFALSGLEQAKAYLDHPVLGSRLIACTEAVNSLRSDLTAHTIFSTPDDLKFHSSMTLFSAAASDAGREPTPFQKALERYFGGKPDERTIDRLTLSMPRM